MKKFLVAAMMVLGATSAFAGDSDALKAVMKAKTYAEAEALVKQNLGRPAEHPADQSDHEEERPG